MAGDSEEKTLDPSEHKLRKAREKGQVASSADFVSGMSVTVGICYLLFAWPSITASLTRLFDLSIFSIQRSDPERGLAVFLTLVFEIGYVISPFILAIIITGILANILEKQGIPFSTHPIKPDFSKINPGSGLKKLFSKRNATEFAVSFVKLVVWFSLSGLFVWLLLQTILASLYCSIGCVVDSATSLGLFIVVTAVTMLAFLGLMDLPLQRALFNHEQKMGHKEMKQELKDILGSPEFKGHRKREHQKLVSGGESAAGSASGKIADGQAGMSAIIRGFDVAIAIFFHKEHADVPVVVARYKGTQLASKMDEAEKMGIYIGYDHELASDIFKSVDNGSIVRERHFEKVARILVQSGAI